jgi:hypothetical protein
MLWSLILIRFQSYEPIPLVIAFPTVSPGADEKNSYVSRISIYHKYYTSGFPIIRENDSVCSRVLSHQMTKLLADRVSMHKTQKY